MEIPKRFLMKSRTYSGSCRTRVVTSTFKAPASATVISPLSTLIEAGARSGVRESDIKAALGIDASVSLLSLDPVAQTLSGDSAQAAIALKVKAASVMVSNLMDVGSSLIQGAKSSATSDFSANVVSSLVSKIQSEGSSLDLGKASTVTEVLTQALSNAAASASAGARAGELERQCAAARDEAREAVAARCEAEQRRSEAEKQHAAAARMCRRLEASLRAVEGAVAAREREAALEVAWGGGGGKG